MSSTSGPARLRIEPRPSTLLAATLAVLHGAVGVVVLSLPLAWDLQLLVSALILLGLLDALRTHLLHRGRAAVRSAQWRGGGEWWLRNGDGEAETGRLDPSTLVLPRLVVLRLRSGSVRRRTLILPADALDPDTHRRLRALLLSADQTRGA